MSTHSIIERIQGSALAEWMRHTSAAPVIEATHVVAAVLLFGTVLVVDLRLLGLADSSRPFSRVGRETLPLVWLAFVVSVITGSLMFTPSAQTYAGNTAFQLKAMALLGAGLNMALFHLGTARRLPAWDVHAPAPQAARLAGLASVLLWSAVVLLGRWIGFTKGYDFSIPPGVELGFPIGPE
ncbi:MAG TPA: DUF6644 family protein [Gemmatimonadaceae bacterium]